MRGESTLIWILIFFIILAILIRSGLLGPIQDWVARRYVFPEQCEKQYPMQYRYMIYDYCNLAKYNLSLEDIDVRTVFIPPESCKFMIYIKNNKVSEFELKYKQGKIIKCEEIISGWL
ncbi:MAG: hypothetical protein QW714_00135 [Nanopusillaceae archaeon]